jgi:hypothetical protein
MRYRLLCVISVLAIAIAPSFGRAEDCTGKLTSQQQDIYSHLSAENQKILTGELKTRDGKPASCEFRGGLMDMLANFPPEKRDGAFIMLVNRMLIRQK